MECPRCQQENPPQARLNVLLGRDAGLEPLKQVLVERTEGNPFFLEESVRTLVETQALIGERGAHRLAKALQIIEVPATVHAVLAARIDRLPPGEKRLLQFAAVIGKGVPFGVLQAIAELPEAELGSGLAHLQAAEFLYETRLFPDLEHTFQHALTHDVAYGSLLQERRRALHAAIVAAIEALYPDRLAEQALAALDHLPETRETLEQGIDLRLDLRIALIGLGELERLFGYLREAERLAMTLDDQRRLGWVSVFMSHYFWITGHPTEAHRFAERSQASAQALGDVRLEVLTNNYPAYACRTSGD